MFKKRINSLFTSKENVNAPVNSSALLDVIDNFSESEINVPVTSLNGTKFMRISSLIDHAREQGKDIIFTFTPGPFIDAKELPENWMKIPAAVGCTSQLTALEASSDNLNAVVIAINKQTSEYQKQLLAAKKLPHLYMISDADGKLEKAFKLPTLNIPDERYPNRSSYFNRFTFVFRQNGMRTLIVPNSPVDKVNADDHIQQIKDFTQSVVECPGIKS